MMKDYDLPLGVLTILNSRWDQIIQPRPGYTHCSHFTDIKNSKGGNSLVFQGIGSMLLLQGPWAQIPILGTKEGKLEKVEII